MNMEKYSEDYDTESVIARDIMTPYVYMMPSTSTLEEVIKFLHDKDISAVFIYKEDQAPRKNPDCTPDMSSNKNPDKVPEHVSNKAINKGSPKEFFIISQTDIVRFLATGGIKESMIDMVPASRIMKGPIQMLDQTTPVDLVIRFMADNNYKRALIKNDHKAVGVISTRDILIWNDVYFKPAKAYALLFIKNHSGVLIGKKIFKDTLEQEKEDLDMNLIDLYGGALHSITQMTNEVMKKKGHIKTLARKNATILLEPREYITAILICDNNSIEMRTKLVHALEEFQEKYKNLLQPYCDSEGRVQEPKVSYELDIDDICSGFERGRNLVKFARKKQQELIEEAIEDPHNHNSK